MDIECQEFDLDFGHVSDVDVGIGKHISDLPHEFCTFKEVQFLGHTDMDGIHTGIIERSEMLREAIEGRVVADQQDTEIVKKGLFGNFMHRFRKFLVSAFKVYRHVWHL